MYITQRWRFNFKPSNLQLHVFDQVIYFVLAWCPLDMEIVISILLYSNYLYLYRVKWYIFNLGPTTYFIGKTNLGKKKSMQWRWFIYSFIMTFGTVAVLLRGNSYCNVLLLFKSLILWVSTLWHVGLHGTLQIIYAAFFFFLELFLTIFSPREYAKYSGELASITGNYFLNPLDDLNSILLPQGHYKER